MNQKLSWTLLVAGACLFLYQVGDLVASHSTWHEVFAPVGMGEILKTLGGAMLAVFGAIGINLKGKGGVSGDTGPTARAPHPADVRRQQLRDRRNGHDTVSDATRRNLPPAVVLAFALALPTLGSCAANRALVTSTPTASEIQAVQTEAVRIAQATTTTLLLTSQALGVADELQKAHVITAGTLAALATDAKAFGQAATKGLDALESITTAPSLRSTVTALLQALQPLITRLQAAGDRGLQLLGTSIDIAVTGLKAYVVHGGTYVEARAARRD